MLMTITLIIYYCIHFCATGTAFHRNFSKQQQSKKQQNPILPQLHQSRTLSIQLKTMVNYYNVGVGVGL